MPSPDVLIVGGGIAGLCCARRLTQCGISFQIFEASDAVGGRARTDEVDGFLLDRGYQVYLTAYPEGRRILDLDELQLRPFNRGAVIWFQGRFHQLADPRQAPLTSLLSLASPIGTMRDKWRLGLLGWDLLTAGEDDAFQSEDRLTLDLLRWNARFSESMIDRFWRPLLGRIFLEKDLTTSSRFFRFVMRLIALGDAAIPARGMRAIPEQLAARLPDNTIRLNAQVERIEKGKLTLGGGEELVARTIILAVDGVEGARLIGGDWQAPKYHGMTTLYYSADRPPVHGATLVLDGENKGPVNSLVVPTEASPTYAPHGEALVAAQVLGVPAEEDASLDFRARGQLGHWFGSEVARWRLLRVYRIPHALPAQPAGTLEPPQRPVRVYPGLYICGDHRDNPSIDGAMTSGFRAAQTVMDDMHRGIV